jgi:hypothetical protein
VTSQGKTSTDIHLVLDAVDLLQHETRFDEFIVFSADADFTPLLRKLRRHDRRTTVLAIGFPSAAYQASADLLIPERLFVGEALFAIPKGEVSEAGASVVVEQRPPVGALDDRSGTDAVVPVPAPVSAATKPVRPAVPSELVEIANAIWLVVDESPTPVASGLLASRLKTDYPEVLGNWNGCGAFRPFFASLKLARLEWVSGSGGRIIDPARHEVEGKSPCDEPDSEWAQETDLFKVVKEVCSLTRAPMLTPRILREVLIALSTELSEEGFKPSTTATQVCARCLACANIRIRQRDVTFLIRGMQLNGHVFGQGADQLETLASRLVGQILFLCQREQMVLEDVAVTGIRRWIGGEAWQGST